MPTGFDFCASPTANVNPHGLTQNCYFCTVAALKNMDVLNLVNLTETMQQDTAQTDEIRRLFYDAGLSGEPFIRSGFNLKAAGPGESCDAQQAKWVIETSVSAGQYCGVNYFRPDGTGHLIVGYRSHDPGGTIVMADFQLAPAMRQDMAWPPEGGHQYRYLIWLNTEDDMDID